VPFARLLGRKPARPAPSTGGRLVYAVGDVHGRLDLLDPLLRDIAGDVVTSHPAERPLMVMLGDYVDRGPDSQGVIDRLLRLKRDPRFEVVTLKGNHEDFLLRFLLDPAVGYALVANGGGATLQSYGVRPTPSAGEAGAWGAVREAFAAALPPSHKAFLEQLQLSAVAGDYAFVHAGVRPGAPLEAQSEQDLMWIRYEFLQCKDDFGKVVVHGHTPSSQAELLENRLGIDTGAYASGVLTAVRLLGHDRRLLQARDDRLDEGLR
jgi:serine/threonine protein phosphatase 1